MRAKFYDGRQMRPIDVLIGAHELDLVIMTATDGTPMRNWAWKDVVVMSRPGGGVEGVLSHRSEADCRLVIDEGLWASEIALKLPARNPLPPMGNYLALFLGAIAVVAAIIWGTPLLLDMSVRLVPRSWEEPVGDMASASFVEGGVCKGSQVARDALERVAKQLDENHGTFKVTVVNEKIVNALTFPGQRILLFRGFVDQSATQEEFLGVLAHEVGHAYYRHPFRGFARQMGMRVLLGLLVGDAGALTTATDAANTLLALQGSREFELEADAYAVKVLAKNGIGTGGLATFLKKAEAEFKKDVDIDIPEFMSTHPVNDTRIEKLNAEIAKLDKKAKKAPARGFTDREWAAVKAYCR
jgi:Zn-dependent protease with chaperone function